MPRWVYLMRSRISAWFFSACQTFGPITNLFGNSPVSAMFQICASTSSIGVEFAADQRVPGVRSVPVVEPVQIDVVK